MKKLLTVVALAAITAGLAFAAGTASAVSRQAVYGTEGPDVIHGNQIQGKPSQVIYALGGNDRVWGGKGADITYGGEGNDRLHAFHAGNDELVGGPGYDTCTVDSKDANVDCEVVVLVPKQGHG